MKDTMLSSENVFMLEVSYISMQQDVSDSTILFQAEDQIHKYLDDLNLKYAHAYMFPDGSLYKYVEFSGGSIELSNLLSSKITEENKGPIHAIKVNILEGSRFEKARNKLNQKYEV